MCPEQWKAQSSLSAGRVRAVQAGQGGQDGGAQAPHHCVGSLQHRVLGQVVDKGYPEITQDDSPVPRIDASVSLVIFVVNIGQSPLLWSPLHPVSPPHPETVDDVHGVVPGPLQYEPPVRAV